MKKILILLAFVIVGMACKEDNTNEAPSIIVSGNLKNLKPAIFIRRWKCYYIVYSQ